MSNRYDIRLMLALAILFAGLLVGSRSAQAVVVHATAFDFRDGGPHDVNSDNQPSVTFGGLSLPSLLGGTFDLQISASPGDGINTSVTAGIGVQGAPDGNRLGVGETLGFQTNNVSSGVPTQVRFLNVAFSDPAATTGSNRLVTGETATFATSDGNNGNINGVTVVFEHSIPSPATGTPPSGASITFGAASGNYMISGLRVGFVDPTLDSTPLDLTFGNDDVGGPGVEAVIFGSGNTGTSGPLTQSVNVPAALGGGTFDLTLNTTGGNANINTTGIGVQGAPNSNRIGDGELVSLTFDNLPPGILGVVVEAMRSDSGNGTDSLLADGELAGFMGGTNLGVVLGSDSRDTFLPVPGGVSLANGESIQFTLDPNSGTPGTGAVGYRIAGLRIGLLTQAPNVPEPATALLGLVGLATLTARRRRAYGA